MFDDTDNALLTYDFRQVFPHKTWISDWATDDTYPKGFRYKVMAASHEDEKSIELLIVLQQHDGSKQVLKHYDLDAAAFDRVAATFVEGLAEQHGLSFEEQDFRSCRTAEQFEAQVARFGWTSKDI
jgi:hypothetical protein